MGVLPRNLRLPKREDAHFLSLIAVGSLLMTVFVMFIGTAGHKASQSDQSRETFSPQYRRRSLEVRFLLAGTRFKLPQLTPCPHKTCCYRIRNVEEHTNCGKKVDLTNSLLASQVPGE